MGRNNDQDIRDRHRRNTSKGVARSALQRTCPECKRQGAITRTNLDPWSYVKKCRYCGYEKGGKIE